MNTFLSRAECSALRGIAIIGIFLHNYLHWLNSMVKENEYTFNPKNVYRLMRELDTASWVEIPCQLMSFFGHYGVPVFVFLSGYGLVKKYESTKPEGVVTKPTWQERGEFLWKHYMKLFPMMLLGFAIFAMVDWITPGRHHWTWYDIIGQLTMTINLFPDPAHSIWPGQYWFFGLMMQLYLIYILLLKDRSWTAIAVLMLISVAVQMGCYENASGDELNWIRYNFFGNMVPFGIGILTARHWDDRFVSLTTSRLHNSAILWMALLLVSLMLICIMSLDFWLWLWVPIIIIVANIALIKLLPGILFKIMCWVGSISSAIFVCHPITRKIFIPISRGGDLIDGLTIYIVTTILLAMLFSRIMSHKS